MVWEGRYGKESGEQHSSTLRWSGQHSFSTKQHLDRQKKREELNPDTEGSIFVSLLPINLAASARL